MDLIILREPWKDLFLLAFSGRGIRKKPTGFLLGQKMVDTYLVQKILVIPWPYLFSPAVFIETESQEKLQILGVFNFGQGAEVKENMKQPLFCEKVILSIKTEKPAGLTIHSRIVRFDRGFYFVRPDRLVLEMEEKNGRK